MNMRLDPVARTATPVSHITTSWVNPSIEQTRYEGQFSIEFGPQSTMHALFLTPELAAEWVAALTPLAAKAGQS